MYILFLLVLSHTVHALNAVTSVTVPIYTIVLFLILLGLTVSYFSKNEFIFYLFEVLAMIFVPVLVFKIGYDIIIGSKIPH